MTGQPREVARGAGPAGVVGPVEHGPVEHGPAGVVGPVEHGPVEHGPAAGALRLQDAAARHGAFSWTERRLFALTGAWAAAPGLADEARLSLFEWSAQHAWHAQLWMDRLPVLADVDREELVRFPSEALATALEGLGPAPAPERAIAPAGAAGFLVGLSTVVLPGLLAAYRTHGERLVPVADRPAARALDLVVRDEVDELAALERLADAALAGAASAGADAAAGARQVVSRLEAVLGAGGGSGAHFSCSAG